jgi:Na+/H+ antiporter NhaC
MIVSLIIYGFVSLIMIGIGVSQLKSKIPVGFYSGEKPPTAEELTDVSAWNKKHGIMWLIYGVVILLSGFIGFFMGDSVWSVIPFAAGTCFPLIFMILYHSVLVKRYKK